MRSSGRTLIRAYHADKSDRVGNDMSFFGGRYKQAFNASIPQYLASINGECGLATIQ